MNIRRSNLLAVLALLGALVLPFGARSEEGRPVVTAYSARDTGSGSESWVTAQDANGVLYFGGDEVLSFDGERWSKYPVPGSYAVRGLSFGNDGRLWVAAFNEIGYFERSEKGLSAFHSLRNELPESSRELRDVWQVFAHNGGAVFITGDSVLVWDGNQFEIFPIPGARRLLAIQVEGKIFVLSLIHI